ncbi:MAG: DNA repair protein RecO [Acidimicrobiales bacterium]
MPLIRDEGIVLRTYRLGEADRIVVLLTLERGKVRAVAKGVRKTKSRFGGRLEPPAHLRLLLYQGRGELEIISQVEAIDHHRVLREDLGRLTDAMALVEAVDQVAQPGEANPAVYRMLLGALRTLARSRSPLLVAGFYWKLLALEGIAPVLDVCVRCGAGPAGPAGPAGELVALDQGEGGALCRSCRRGTPASPEALALIRRILGGDLGAVLAEPSSVASAQVADLATTWLEHHLDRRLRAVRILDRA